jgi:hypothetical protein
MTKYLHVGGLVAAGLDPSGQYLLTVSHSGRGVWSTSTWERIARDSALAYPVAGRATGIGPIEGVSIPVNELDHVSGTLAFTSEDGSTSFLYESGMIEVEVAAPPNTSLERTREG